MAYLLFDTVIFRKFFEKDKGNTNWERFHDSILKYEPDWEEKHHEVITTSALFLEALGIRLGDINKQLAEFITTHKHKIGFYKTDQSKNSDMLDALFILSKHFYKEHPWLCYENLCQLAKTRFKSNKISFFAEGLYRNQIQFRLDEYNKVDAIDNLYDDLAWEAVARFGDNVRDESTADERCKTSDERDLGMVKAFVDLVTRGVNLSGYRFVSRLFERINKACTDEKVLSARSLSQFTDAGDCDVVHLCVFGSFIYNHENGTHNQESVIAFISDSEKENFKSRVRQYKVMLNYVKETLKWKQPFLPGLVYTIDQNTCCVCERIEISSL